MKHIHKWEPRRLSRPEMEWFRVCLEPGCPVIVKGADKPMRVDVDPVAVEHFTGRTQSLGFALEPNEPDVWDDLRSFVESDCGDK